MDRDNSPGYTRRPIKPVGRARQSVAARPKLSELLERPNPNPAKPSYANRYKPLYASRTTTLLVVIGLVVVVSTIYVAVFSSWGFYTSTQKSTPSNTKSPPPKPNFRIYFPSGLPQELAVNSSAIQYSLDTFGFPVVYNGKSSIYVSEQNAGADFSLKEFRANLTKPIDFSTPAGPAAQGTIGGNTITAIYTSGQSLILINCSSESFCAAQSQSVAQSMRSTTDASLFKN